MFFFLRSHPWHLEVPRLGVQWELQLLAYATATATPDPSRVCDLHRSTRQHWILNSPKWGQGSNLHPHGYQLGLLLLSHDRSSENCCLTALSSPVLQRTAPPPWALVSTISGPSAQAWRILCAVYPKSIPRLCPCYKWQWNPERVVLDSV